VERGRVRRWDRRVAEAGPEPGRPEGFAVAVPEDAPPSATGRRCALEYEIRARMQVGRSGTALASTPVTVAAQGRVHFGPRAWDRVIGHQPGRGFHIELSEATPAGGGTLQGRLHRDGNRRSRPLSITARCLEAWRVPHAGARHSLPAWATETLWSATFVLEIGPDATWAPFRFDLPRGLPPAVEAHSVAWRYELVAHRAGRFRHGLPAILTPMLFEAA
jgi:hypothetical protein